jgi:hypothetical protein
MLEEIVCWWQCGTSGNQDTLIIAISTIIAAVLAATIGAIAVVWQIGKQAKLAISQNKHNEEIKLKLEIFQKFEELYSSWLWEKSKLTSFTYRFEGDLSLTRKAIDEGLPYASLPVARTQTFNSLKAECDERIISFIYFTEKWEIVDPRIRIFRTAINAAKHDINNSYWEYHNLVRRHAPFEAEGSQGVLFPWMCPSQQIIDEIKTEGNRFRDSVDDLASYCSDFRVEMQNILLGELFSRKLPAKKPLDPALKVITLDKHEELERFFNTQTAWGKHKSEIEAKVRENLAGGN